MVFKTFGNLARQSLGKPLAHGYAQSVVAASQSSYASSNTHLKPFGHNHANKSNRPPSAQFHAVFQNTSSISDVANKPACQVVEHADSHDGGLSTYYEAWQKQQQNDGADKEWRQFQFTKRIGWKALLDGNKKDRDDVLLRKEAFLGRGGLKRANSTSAVDDIKKIENEVIEAAAAANAEEAIAEESNLTTEPSKPATVFARSVSGVPSSGTLESPLAGRVESTSSSTLSSSFTAGSQSTKSPVSSISSSSDPRAAESEAFSNHLGKLSDAGHFVEIPPAFESMLSRGLRPTAIAYNALLAAATNLPIAQHLIVPKALDVYSDMLRRNVVPDTGFFGSLIQVLSRRALSVLQQKSIMDKQMLRFGSYKSSGRFLLMSSETEYDILAEDDALNNAIRIFDASVSMDRNRLYAPETYKLLVTACAKHKRLDDMIRAYSHMETQKVTPIATMFPPMIEAFALSGDLGSAVQCYEEYRTLAILDNAGDLAIIERNDNNVYAAVVKAYAKCGKPDGGDRFFNRILGSFENVQEAREERMGAVRDTIVIDAIIQEHLDAGNIHEALNIADQQSLTPPARNHALAKICAISADKNDVDTALRTFKILKESSPTVLETSDAALSMLSLHIRLHNLDLAQEVWSALRSFKKLSPAFIEPTVTYALALISTGSIDEGIVQAREAFSRIRSSTKAIKTRSEVSETIDEGIALIHRFLINKGVIPSPQAALSILWAMVENGGLVSPAAEHLLATLGAKGIEGLSWQDRTLALKIEAGFLVNTQALSDVAHSIRFSHILELVINHKAPLDLETANIVSRALSTISHERPDLANKWRVYQSAADRVLDPPAYIQSLPTPAIASPANQVDSFDPYAVSTDFKGSSIIVEELDAHRNLSGLNEALSRFRNMRRAGRHPRYQVYAKLITSASKEGRNNLMHDILGMARQDVPFLPQYAVVRHGWSSILDAMIGACLTIGNRTLAARFHQELLDMGSAPTANTFGLYITTLKESTKTFDEATEAVKIYHRAKTEGVEPSSFLYNALIGKLGKARRIDDCLFYFTEMRALRIRPTSVTYGTIVNALCRVSDDRFAEELFDEMESMPNYKPRPAPYNSLMQYFLTSKRDSTKVLAYYDRMRTRNIEPTMHTYKLLIDTYATLEPINLSAAEGVLDTIRASGQRPEAVHYASLIHAKGCSLHDMQGARQIFDEVIRDGQVRPQACLYQALFESMVANHCVSDTEEVLQGMGANGVAMTPYIANTLIHGWAMQKNVDKSKAAYENVGMDKREPSTYEAMTRAFLAVENRNGAMGVVHEMLSRGYPSAVSSKILELLGHGPSRASSVAPMEVAA